MHACFLSIILHPNISTIQPLSTHTKHIIGHINATKEHPIMLHMRNIKKGKKNQNTLWRLFVLLEHKKVHSCRVFSCWPILLLCFVIWPFFMHDFFTKDSQCFFFSPIVRVKFCFTCAHAHEIVSNDVQFEMNNRFFLNSC